MSPKIHDLNLKNITVLNYQKRICLPKKYQLSCLSNCTPESIYLVLEIKEIEKYREGEDETIICNCNHQI